MIPSSLAVKEVIAPLRRKSITNLKREMSTGEQSLTDGWDIHRNKDGKGQDSCSDHKGREAGVIEIVVRIYGEEVGADAQDDKSEAENDAWKSPETCEQISTSREAERGVRGVTGKYAHRKRRGGRFERLAYYLKLKLRQ